MLHYKLLSGCALVLCCIICCYLVVLLCYAALYAVMWLCSCAMLHYMLDAQLFLRPQGAHLPPIKHNVL